MPLSFILIRLLFCYQFCRKSLRLNMPLCVAQGQPSKARSSQVDRGEGGGRQVWDLSAVWGFFPVQP